MAIVDKENPKIIEFYPKSIEEIKKSGYSKMILKFSTERCPPCNRLAAWLEQYAPQKDVPLFNLKSNNGQDEVMQFLCAMFNVQSVPRLIVVDASLNVLESMVGFNAEETDKLIKRHFS